MGFRARKSFKIAPGVRMTVTPRGVGYSVGGKGYRVSHSATGRVTRTVSLPGTGLSHVETLSSGGHRLAPQAPPTAPAPAAPPTPGLFAPRWEKELHRALIAKPNPAAISQVGTDHAQIAPLVAVLDAYFAALPAGDRARARELLARAFRAETDPSAHPFVQRYLPTAVVTIGVAEGIHVELPLDRDTVGLTLAELHQGHGDLQAAIDVVEQLTPSTVAAVSLAELYAEVGRWDDVISLTDGVTNLDEAATYLLTARGVALRESGLLDASLAAFKEALRVRSRPEALRHRALVERAGTYLAQRKKAAARKDLERVYADNSQYPGVKDLLDSLTTA